MERKRLHAAERLGVIGVALAVCFQFGQQSSKQSGITGSSDGAFRGEQTFGDLLERRNVLKKVCEINSTAILCAAAVTRCACAFRFVWKERFREGFEVIVDENPIQRRHLGRIIWCFLICLAAKMPINQIRILHPSGRCIWMPLGSLSRIPEDMF